MYQYDEGAVRSINPVKIYDNTNYQLINFASSTPRSPYSPNDLTIEIKSVTILLIVLTCCSPIEGIGIPDTHVYPMCTLYQ